LKVVEEPPEFLVFVFATTEPDKVLPTIRSRTHHYPFRLIPPSVLRAHLERICQAEQVTVEPTVFPLVVRAGAGSARDSLSVLDQLLSGAGSEGVTYARAVGLLGVTDSALLDDMTDSLAVGDAAGVYATIDRVVEAGHDPRRFAADLLDRFRDLIVLDAVPDAVDKGLIDYAGDQAQRMSDQSRRIGVASLVRFADITHTTLTDMRGTTSPRLMLELLSARMLLPDAASDSAALLQRLERLERRQGLAVPMPAAEQPATPAKAERSAARATATTEPPAVRPEPAAKAEQPAPAAEQPPAAPEQPAAKAEHPAAPAQRPEPASEPIIEVAAAAVVVSGGAPDSNALRHLWPEVMAALRERSKVKWAMMNEVVIASVDGEVVNLLAPAGLARRIAEDANLSVLREVLQSVVFGNWRLTISPATPTNGAAAPVPDEPPADSEPEPGPPRAARPARQSRPAPAVPADQPPPAPVVDDDGVDEEADEVHGSQRAGGDAEAAAMELLQTSLGARPIDAS
ncbi:MAG TPA: DNA polymerase III subunit gamma/tau, partial [Jatrophihabitans sp.]